MQSYTAECDTPACKRTPRTAELAKASCMTSSSARREPGVARDLEEGTLRTLLPDAASSDVSKFSEGTEPIIERDALSQRGPPGLPCDAMEALTA